MSRFEDDWRMLVEVGPWLVGRGFRLIESRGPEGMNSGLHVYAGEAVGLRFLADRGQWFVDARPGLIAGDGQAYDDWFDLERWSRCLGASVTFHDAGPKLTEQDRIDAIAASWWLQPQLAYLREHLESIEGLCDPSRLAETVGCLRISPAAGV